MDHSDSTYSDLKNEQHADIATQTRNMRVRWSVIGYWLVHECPGRSVLAGMMCKSTCLFILQVMNIRIFSQIVIYTYYTSN